MKELELCAATRRGWVYEVKGDEYEHRIGCTFVELTEDSITLTPDGSSELIRMAYRGREFRLYMGEGRRNRYVLDVVGIPKDLRPSTPQRPANPEQVELEISGKQFGLF